MFWLLVAIASAVTFLILYLTKDTSHDRKFSDAQSRVVECVRDSGLCDNTEQAEDGEAKCVQSAVDCMMQVNVKHYGMGTKEDITPFGQMYRNGSSFFLLLSPDLEAIYNKFQEGFTKVKDEWEAQQKKLKSKEKHDMIHDVMCQFAIDYACDVPRAMTVGDGPEDFYIQPPDKTDGVLSDHLEFTITHHTAGGGHTGFTWATAAAKTAADAAVDKPTGMEVRVYRNNSTSPVYWKIEVKAKGVYYSVDDPFIITGDQLGGKSGENDIYFTVHAIDGNDLTGPVSEVIFGAETQAAALTNSLSARIAQDIETKNEAKFQASVNRNWNHQLQREKCLRMYCVDGNDHLWSDEKTQKVIMDKAANGLAYVINFDLGILPNSTNYTFTVARVTPEEDNGSAGFTSDANAVLPFTPWNTWVAGQPKSTRYNVDFLDLRCTGGDCAPYQSIFFVDQRYKRGTPFAKSQAESKPLLVPFIEREGKVDSGVNTEGVMMKQDENIPLLDLTRDEMWTSMWTEDGTVASFGWQMYHMHEDSDSYIYFNVNDYIQHAVNNEIPLDPDFVDNAQNGVAWVSFVTTNLGLTSQGPYFDRTANPKVLSTIRVVLSVDTEVAKHLKKRQ